MTRERLQFAAAGGIPKFDGFVGGAGGNELAVGRIGHGMNTKTVAGLDEDIGAFLRGGTADNQRPKDDEC